MKYIEFRCGISKSRLLILRAFWVKWLWKILTFGVSQHFKALSPINCNICFELLIKRNVFTSRRLSSSTVVTSFALFFFKRWLSPIHPVVVVNLFYLFLSWVIFGLKFLQKMFKKVWCHNHNQSRKVQFFSVQFYAK